MDAIFVIILCGWIQNNLIIDVLMYSLPDVRENYLSTSISTPKRMRNIVWYYSYDLKAAFSWVPKNTAQEFRILSKEAKINHWLATIGCDLLISEVWFFSSPFVKFCSTSWTSWSIKAKERWYWDVATLVESLEVNASTFLTLQSPRV